MDESAVAERVQRADQLLGELDAMPDSRTRSVAMEALQALVELYGEGLSRILAAAAAGPLQMQTLTEDPLVGHLLILHGLHPRDLHARVEQALEGQRPYLRSHGGDVELVAVDGSVAHVRLQGSCDGCPSSAATLQQSVEAAVLLAAPEIEKVVADSPSTALRSGFIPLATVR